MTFLNLTVTFFHIHLYLEQFFKSSSSLFMSKGTYCETIFFSEENEFVTTKHIFQEDTFRLCGKKLYNQDASMWNLTGGWSNLLNNNLVLISWNLEEFKQRKGVECNICTQLLLNTLMLIFCHFIKLKVKRAIFFFLR